MCRREKRETKHIAYMYKKNKNERCITLLSIYSISFSFDNKNTKQKCILLTNKAGYMFKKKTRIKAKRKITQEKKNTFKSK
jgi:predicted class III extradiol MEMO1 family dioxygenase